ncbi:MULTISPECIES: hypothetical protein [unclassified Shewanella]|uniref:hypothetical protein n=1 Tax=unclassified Shewanella TaxID=196818 RepID=UPI001BC3D0A0|nr:MULTISPECIES: hypothetical protein [unclassified Shewanella]GIU21371.1 hypothetical protein TUM4444_40730 [Shewanella sp. MBTL60-112-B1]GIU40424.1 hypothetical protein TUM4445_39520 [Shewanella sp. MBTL60-112-B2]
MKRTWLGLNTTTALLMTGVTLLLLLNANAMHTDYLMTKELRTTNSSGSSLAERYLILGSWPASKDYDLVSSGFDYPINTSNKPASQQGQR